MTPAEIQAAIKAAALKKKKNYKEPVVKEHKMTADEYKGLQRAKEEKAMRRRKPIFELDDLDITPLPSAGRAASVGAGLSATAGDDVLREINQARAQFQREKEEMMRAIQQAKSSSAPAAAPRSTGGGASSAEVNSLKQELEQLRVANQELRAQARVERQGFQKELQEIRAELRQLRSEMSTSNRTVVQQQSTPASPGVSKKVVSKSYDDQSPKTVTEPPITRSNSSKALPSAPLSPKSEPPKRTNSSSSKGTPKRTRSLKPYEIDSTTTEPSSPAKPQRRRSLKPYEVGYEGGDNSTAITGSIASYKPYEIGGSRSKSESNVKRQQQTPAKTTSTTPSKKSAGGIKVTNMSGSASSKGKTYGLPGLGPHSVDTVSKHQSKDNGLKGFISNQAAANSMYTRNDLTIKKLDDGSRIVLFKNKLYIPDPLRSETMQYFYNQYGAKDFKGKLMEECIWPEVTRDVRMYKP